MKSILRFGINKQIIFHVIAWLTFILYEITIINLIREANIKAPAWNEYLLPYLVNITFFYFHAFVTMRLGFGRKLSRLILFIFLILLEFSVYLFIMGAKNWDIANFEKNGFFRALYPTRIFFIRQLWRGIYFLIFGTAFWLIYRSFKNQEKLQVAETNALLGQQEKQQLELKLISTQNAFLQSQINPHLLFNTLNFIHSEVQTISNKASDAIIILSDMMRYSLLQTKEDGRVPLENEVEQIDNLIKINQFRFNNKLCIDLLTEGEVDYIWIIPLLLIPFVENLFKYAELKDEANPAKIIIKISNTLLLFKTFNNKRKTISYSSTGIGIENVKTRLSSYYENKFSLNIEDLDSTFSVTLMVQLQTNS